MFKILITTASNSYMDAHIEVTVIEFETQKEADLAVQVLERNNSPSNTKRTVEKLYWNY